MKKLLLVSILTLTSFLVFAAPDETAMGKSSGYPACSNPFANMECRVGSFSNPVGSVVSRSSNPNILPYANFKLDLDNYFNSQKATGLMVIKNGKIVYENYQYDRNLTSTFRGYSMSKTIIAMLVGIANEKGYIRSLDDTADNYYEELKGTVWGSTTIRNFLRMASGVKYNENIESNPWGLKSDMFKWYADGVDNPTKGKNSSATMAQTVFNTRAYEQGTRFNYSTPETSMLTRILVRATGRSITALTKEWIWDPIGAEDNGYWKVSPGDQVEQGEGGYFATLRDWGKFGLLLANDGKVDNRQVIPQKFLIEATDSKLQPYGFKPREATKFYGYGYLTWIFPMKERSFALEGVYGQSIYVQPSSGVVMIQTSVYDQPTEAPQTRDKIIMFRQILKALGGNGD